MHKIYTHEGYLVIPNWEGSKREYFHILDKKENCITGFDNEKNINTLKDAERFINNYKWGTYATNN